MNRNIEDAEKKENENKFPYRVGTALSDALEHGNPEKRGLSQKFKVEPKVEEAAREAQGGFGRF